MKPGAVLLTLDPAAAYANLLLPARRHRPRRRAPVPPVDVPGAHHQRGVGRHVRRHRRTAGRRRGLRERRRQGTRVDRDRGALRLRAGLDVHWVTIKQLAQLEPTLVETVACMIGALLNEALEETVHTMGVPEPAARAMLFGHAQVALANGLRG